MVLQKCSIIWQECFLYDSQLYHDITRLRRMGGWCVLILFALLSHTHSYSQHSVLYENVSANLRFKITSVNKRQYVMMGSTSHFARHCTNMQHKSMIVIMSNWANLCDAALVVQFSLLTQNLNSFKMSLASENKNKITQ